MRTLHVGTQTHGRVLVEDPANSLFAGRLLVLFHGYAQSAGDILDAARRIPGVSTWTLVSVQALHRFYSRDNTKIIASWMTRQDRDLAIADNVAYVESVIDTAIGPSGHRVIGSSGHRIIGSSDITLVFLGFSQGASMAYRAARLGRHKASGVVALGGDIPPEVKDLGAPGAEWPPVLIGAGVRDTWYTATKLAEDEAFLRGRGAPLEVVRFEGGHEWTEEFREAAGRWLARRAGPRD